MLTELVDPKREVGPSTEAMRRYRHLIPKVAQAALASVFGS
jgi:hypothetical protein